MGALAADAARGAVFETVKQHLSSPPEFNQYGQLAVSHDAQTIIGSWVTLRNGNYFYEPAIWRAGPGISRPGLSPGFDYTYPGTISADGSVIAGYSEGGTGGAANSFRWTAATGYQQLGHVAGFNGSFLTGVSPDGSTSFGDVDNVFGFGTEDQRIIAARWSEATGIELLGFLPGGGLSPISVSAATAASADGSVLVGLSDSKPDRFVVDREAFRWTRAGGMQPLGFLPNTHHQRDQYSEATLVSYDGTVVAGTSQAQLGLEAFRWTNETGMVGLGALPGSAGSRPRAMSSDGSVIVGLSSGSAFVWDVGHGMRNLQQVLIDEYGLAVPLAGWQLQSADVMSSDGNVIIGRGINPLGQEDRWIVTLNAVPEPSGLALALLAALSAALLVRCRSA